MNTRRLTPFREWIQILMDMFGIKRCPCCGKEMIRGEILSKVALQWREYYPSDWKAFFASPAFPPKGSVELSDCDGIFGARVIAWNCRECQIIYIDYKDDNCDYHKVKRRARQQEQDASLD